MIPEHDDAPRDLFRRPVILGDWATHGKAGGGTLISLKKAKKP
jgi:hypothetical protein